MDNNNTINGEIDPALTAEIGKITQLEDQYIVMKENLTELIGDAEAANSTALDHSDRLMGLAEAFET